MSKLSEITDIPVKCELGNTVFKKFFYENAKLNRSDRDLFIQSIDKIKWEYCLKNETINIKPFKDDIREYSEVEILKIGLKIPNKTKRIAEIVMRAIPYPMVIIFQYGNQIQLFTAHQRLNLSNNNKNALEELIFTDWINLDDPDEADEKLFENLNIKNLSFTNFYTFYKDIVDALIKYNVSKLIGEPVADDADEVKSLYDDLTSLDTEIEAIKSRMGKETQFNRRLEMNIKVKELEDQKKELTDKLN
ncbi:DUF4391 domain-containing protein [Methanobacterium aggregans]|uniref:DUF4391 domain-containing protein n=1 Tax=Methanobacterium aggregans TaxID=1615586 RepID=UPI001AE75BD4|nr:DUF4391 domain-containing protein [Methanobacterium aggregans]MBP2046743.1 hypothetical protein [Methanobacterium aggregans]